MQVEAVSENGRSNRQTLKLFRAFSQIRGYFRAVHSLLRHFWGHFWSSDDTWNPRTVPRNRGRLVTWMDKQGTRTCQVHLSNSIQTHYTLRNFPLFPLYFLNNTQIRVTYRSSTVCQCPNMKKHKASCNRIYEKFLKNLVSCISLKRNIKLLFRKGK